MTRYSLTPFRTGRSALPFGNLNSEMERLLSDFFGGDTTTEASPIGNIRVPPIDFAESKDAYHLTAELPGVEQSDLDVSVSDNVLTIRAEKKAEEKKEDHNYYRYERSYGSYQRQLQLPGEVNADKADVSFKNGVLSITLPKQEIEQTKVKKLTVKAK